MVQRGEIVKAFASVSIYEWVAIFSLIFGGCCSNVFVLEKFIKQSTSPNKSFVLTFFQFLFVAANGYVRNIDMNKNSIKRLYLPQLKIPLRRHWINVLLSFISSTLNNIAFSFDISVPIHIIIRSLGTATTMIIGYLFFNKRYSLNQIMSAIILTIGVMVATLNNKRNSSSITSNFIDNNNNNNNTNQDGIGAMILLIATIAGTLAGLYTEITFFKYGRHWEENLFFMHLLSLPLFMIISPSKLWKELQNLFYGGNTQLQMTLLLNCFTQVICVNGVNRLAGNSTSLTVNIVLLVRKFVSLIISVIAFGYPISAAEVTGALLVFSGALLYSYSSYNTNTTTNTRTGAGAGSGASVSAGISAKSGNSGGNSGGESGVKAGGKLGGDFGGEKKFI